VSAGPDWETSDSELVGQAAGGGAAADRADAFQAIYMRHYAAVLQRSRLLLRDRQQAEDLCHDAFVAAFADLRAGRAPAQPERLRAWLCGIAANRANRYRRGANPAGRRYGLEMLVADQDLVDGIPADDDPRSAELGRHAHVERLLAVVAATFSERQRRIYELSVGEGLAGADLAARLGVSPAQASRLANETRTLALEGFGALVLARDGSRFCATLAGILEQGAWDGENFTGALRQRIISHFGTCPTCDRCAICTGQRKRLSGAYAPALVPALYAVALRQRALSAIGLAASPTDADQDDGQRPTPPRRGRRVLLPLAAIILLLAGATTALVLLLSGGGGQPAPGGVSSRTLKMGFHLTSTLLSDPLAPASGGPEVTATIDSALRPARALPGTVVHVAIHSVLDEPYVDFTAGGHTVCLAANQHDHWGTGYRWDNNPGAPTVSGQTGIHHGNSYFVLLYPVPPAAPDSLPVTAPARLPASIKVISSSNRDTGCGTLTSNVADVTFTVPRTGRLSHGTFLVSALGEPKITHVESITNTGHIIVRNPGSVGAMATGTLSVLTIGR
jgi:RNA polymerase sigma factor (sigma-70 family)